ncbi:MAG: hypothetical protein L0Z62_23865 [Gemmataceae bacterium]|nr:hypothetical protein [Gemmataceae bacterium]
MTADKVAATRRPKVVLAAVLSATLAVACLADWPAADAQEKPRYARDEKPKSAAKWVRPADEVGPAYWVYDDKSMEFIGSGYMPDAKGNAQSVKFEKAPHTGKYCIQARYKLADNPWVGISFLLDGKWENHKRKLNVFGKLEAKKGDPKGDPIVRVHHDGEAEIGRQSLADRSPSMAVVVAAQHADVWPPPSRPIPFGPAAVILHIEPAWRVLVSRDLMHALAEFRERIGHEAGANTPVRCLKRLAAVLAQVVAAGRDAEVEAIAIAQDGVHAESAVTRVPLPSMFVVADPRNHLPGIATVAAVEEGRRLDSAREVLLVLAYFEGPDVGECPAVLLGEGRRRHGLLELLAQISRKQDLHAEERVAARGIQPRATALVDQRRVNSHPGAEGPAQRETAPRLRRLGDEESFLGPDTQKNAIRHVQPPETAGSMVSTSPGTSAVSRPSRSHT